MSKEVDMSHIQEFLLCPTPQAWIDEALKPENLPILLLDHAACELKAANSAMSLMFRYSGTPKPSKQKKGSSCNADNSEKKAASTALNLIYRYIDKFDVMNKMSKLAREELRHFEQVIAILKRRGLAYEAVSPSRYAGSLHQLISTHEPKRLVDTLIVGSIIEARSCERFAALAGYKGKNVLDEELKNFYLSLLKSESRHFRDYLALAEKYSDEDITDRVAFFLKQERELIESPDPEFRFHSGVLD